MPETHSNSSESVSNENVARILALLKTGDEKIGSTKVNNAILILGKSGSGKTTLTNFLAGNDEDLISEELGQDSGEFIIRDKGNKISGGNSTIISKTIFPELIYDSETKTAYIDCPGFNDRGRNEAYDIAAAYFIKKVLGNVKNIKIVLTANYPSLRSGVSRDDFPDLLERATTLIKNIDRYVDSVALIATKVDNSYTKRNVRGEVKLVLVPDKLVIENIAKFLSQVQESLRDMRSSDQILKSNSTLSHNESFYNSSQKLIDSLLLKKGDVNTRLGLFRRPDTAGPLSEIELLQKGKKILKNILKNNIEYAPVDVTSIGYAVSDKSKNIIRDLVEEINKSIVSDMSQINDILIGFFKRLENDMFDDSIHVLKEHLEAWSATLAKISAISESANANELVSLIENNFTESCKRASKLLLEDMKKLGDFVTFFQDVSGKQFDSFAWKWVSELKEAVTYVENSLKWYSFLIALHQRLSDYEVQKDVKRFHVPNFDSASGQLENFPDFFNFFNEISNSHFLNVQYLEELQKTTIDDTKVRYFNQVIKSTLRQSLNFSRIENPGPRLQVTGEYVKISDVILHSFYPGCKSVHIIATHTVFIDADMTKENDISIVSPRWIIIGSRVINLNGSSADDWVPPKASNGWCDGCNGINGLPGKPGKSAGHFFGIGDVFENASQLKIQAVGGAGGKGQNGGDGVKGGPGRIEDIGKFDADWKALCDSDQTCTLIFGPVMDFKVMFWGPAGKRGGDAGRGGAHGLGGFAGIVTLIGIGNEKSSILQEAAAGNYGEFGSHGRCGEGGKGGDNIWLELVRDCSNTTLCWVRTITSHYAITNGDKGTCFYKNSNHIGLEKPAEITFFYPPASMISDVRKELVKNFANCVRKSHSKKFYEMLLKEDILKYDTADLILSEFQQLQYYTEFPPYFSKTLYEFVLKRINKISNSSNDQSNPERKKQFEFLSSAVISKLTRLEKNQNARLVFNHREHSDVLKTTNMEKINDHFINRISKEIKHTENFVEIVSGYIYDVIERCIFNIYTFPPNNDLDLLERRLLKLKLFSNLKIINYFFTLATSLAKADLALIQTMRITDTLPSLEISLSAVDGSMINAKLAAIMEKNEKEINAVEGAASNAIRSLQSLGDEFDLAIDQLRDVVMNLKSRLSFFNKSAQFSIFSSIANNEMKTITGVNFSLLKNSMPEVNETVGRFENDLKIIQWNVDLFAATTTEKFDRPTVTISIDNIQEKSENLDEIALGVLYSLKSLLVTLRNSLTGDLYKSEDIGKLRVMVSDALGTIKWKFHQMIAQVEIDEDLQITIQNFDEVLNQLSTIFSQILPDQHNRAILKNLHTQLMMKREPNDQFQKYLTEVIGADALLYEYEHFIDACRMSIFPFEILTNKMPSFPSALFVDGSLIQYQSIIASNLKLVESELESWEQLIKNKTAAEDFKSSNKNGAFFVWRNDHYKESISKLLRGREVVLKAQIKVGDKQQMLKFDNIRLRFTSSNLTLQNSLDGDLKYFNVLMTHVGNSYFSLCNRVRLVHQDATRFSHNFIEPVARVIDPLNSSLKPVLSPFATWIFKLNPIHENMDFSILSQYRKLAVSVELEGNATYIDSLNRTICQEIDFSDFDAHQLPSKTGNGLEIANNTSLPSSTDPLKSVRRKRRDIESSKIERENQGFKWWNPFNYFSDVKPDPKFELPSKTLFLGRNEEHLPNVANSPSLNINGVLALIDFVVRNITKIKPYQSMEKLMSAEEARVIALNIIEELDNMLSQVPEEKRISLSDWQEKDPVELLGQLEKKILTGDLSSVKEILFGLVPLDIPDDELDSLLGRHLGGAEIQRSYENSHNVVPDADGRSHLSEALADYAGIPLINESSNQPMLN